LADFSEKTRKGVTKIANNLLKRNTKGHANMRKEELFSKSKDWGKRKKESWERNGTIF